MLEDVDHLTKKLSTIQADLLVKKKEEDELKKKKEESKMEAKKKLIEVLEKQQALREQERKNELALQEEQEKKKIAELQELRKKEEEKRKQREEREKKLWNVNVSNLKLSPKFEVNETAEAYIISSYIPGLVKEDIHMKLSEEDNLNVEGVRFPPKENLDLLLSRVSSEEELYRSLHGKYGRFSETFKLPAEVNRDNISASYVNGILRISVPKIKRAARRNFYNDRNLWW